MIASAIWSLLNQSQLNRAQCFITVHAFGLILVQAAVVCKVIDCNINFKGQDDMKTNPAVNEHTHA